MTTIERQKLEDAIRVFYIDKKELEFREVIGKGGFGLVTKGYYRGKKCAIKSIYIPANTRYSGGLTSDDPYLDFLNEMNVQLKLDHQNILTVYGWSSDEACLYVVMELMRKSSQYFNYLLTNEYRHLSVSVEQITQVHKTGI